MKKSQFNPALSRIFRFALITNLVVIILQSILTGNMPYFYLLWNLFLASLPFFISLYLSRDFSMKTNKTWILLALWLLFLPNAPYVITDFVHLDPYSEGFWPDILILLLSAFNGLCLGATSIWIVLHCLGKTIKKRWIVLIEGLIILISAYGVFIGRFLRYNSWDVFIKPLSLFQDMYQSLGIHTVQFVLFYSLVCYAFQRIIKVILLPFYQGEI